MSTIDNLMAALEEGTLARNVGITHDEARMRYSLRSNTVATFDEFSRAIGDYFNYHFTRCISGGGGLSQMEAQARAKEIIEKEYRRRNGGDIVSAFKNAQDGTNGGMRAILDLIGDALKAEGIERYTREVFDAYVSPESWEQKVAIIRQFIERSGMENSSAIRADQPERYAHEYRDLIRAFVEARARIGSVARRL